MIKAIDLCVLSFCVKRQRIIAVAGALINMYRQLIIAWFVPARLITSGGRRVKQEKRVEGLPKELAVVICPNCGEAFARRSNRQQFCTKEECRKAHNALRQKKYRENKKLKEM